MTVTVEHWTGAERLPDGSKAVRNRGGVEAFDYHQRKPWWWVEPGHRKGPWVMVDMG